MSKGRSHTCYICATRRSVWYGRYHSHVSSDKPTSEEARKGDFVYRINVIRRRSDIERCHSEHVEGSVGAFWFAFMQTH